MSRDGRMLMKPGARYQKGIDMSDLVGWAQDAGSEAARDFLIDCGIDKGLGNRVPDRDTWLKTRFETDTNELSAEDKSEAWGWYQDEFDNKLSCIGVNR